MHCEISPNKPGGCGKLVDYLNKEESLAKDFTEYLQKENQHEKLDSFFNGQSDQVDQYSVINGIDNNCKGLSRNETRFYSLVFNPSEKEIEHILKLADERTTQLIESGMPGSRDDIQDGVTRNLFKEYTKEAMNLYAQNFDRPEIKDNKDIVWFGRVEKNRYWKETSYEVKYNNKIFRQIKRLESKDPTPERNQRIEELRGSLIKESDVRLGGRNTPITPMMPKSGNNYHIHVIVSRKDVTQKVKLSPLAKPRLNTSHKINGRVCRVGFDRNKFYNGLEQNFDKMVGYDRNPQEHYEYRKVLKQSIKDNSIEAHSYVKDIQKSIEASKATLGKVSVKSVNKLTYEAGMKYINQNIKPYTTTVSLGRSGLRIITSNRSASQKAVTLGRSIARRFAIKTGFSMASSVTNINPYVLAVNVIRSGISTARSSGSERE